MFFDENSDVLPGATYAALYNSNYIKTSQVKLADPSEDSTVHPISYGTICEYLNIYQCRVFGDSIYFIVNQRLYYIQDDLSEFQKIENNLKLLLPSKTLVFIKVFEPNGIGLSIDGYSQYTPGPKGTFLIRSSTYKKPWPAILSFFSAERQLLCRVPWDNREDICFFDSNGTAYFVQDSSGKVTVRRYSLEDVLN